MIKKSINSKISVKDYLEKDQRGEIKEEHLLTKNEADSKPFKLCNDAYDGDGGGDEPDIPAD